MDGVGVGLGWDEGLVAELNKNDPLSICHNAQPRPVILRHRDWENFLQTKKIPPSSSDVITIKLTVIPYEL